MGFVSRLVWVALPEQDLLTAALEAWEKLVRQRGQAMKDFLTANIPA